MFAYTRDFLIKKMERNAVEWMKYRELVSAYVAYTHSKLILWHWNTLHDSCKVELTLSQCGDVWIHDRIKKVWFEFCCRLIEITKQAKVQTVNIQRERAKKWRNLYGIWEWKKTQIGSESRHWLHSAGETANNKFVKTFENVIFDDKVFFVNYLNVSNLANRWTFFLFRSNPVKCELALKFW